MRGALNRHPKTTPFSWDAERSALRSATRLSWGLGILALTVGSMAAFPAVAHADVIVRGPFGGLIVVPSPSDVRVGPGGVLVAPEPQPPLPPAPVPVAPAPVVIPLPKTVVAAPVLPQEFVKTFLPSPGAYEVAFVHPRSHQPVTASFVLPQGTPRVYYVPHSVVFDYGRHEVEIRFQIGGRVKVIQR
jgi:hypothetical protein